MEALAAVLRRGSPAAARSDEDQIYEDIEAPKFVDFTAPDRSRPDDRSWFCARIGCDQNHEDVDPDALYKSFLLRVMAARSPNVQLQKALSRQQAPSPFSKKCPRSAPAKSMKGRVAKLCVLASVSEKIGNSSKLKAHPIANLRSTPNYAKPMKRPPTAEKAMTTPRNRMRCPPREEPFRSAKISKVGSSIPKNRTVVKALIFQTPKRAEKAPSTPRTPISGVSVGLNKIKMGGNIGTASAVSRCNIKLGETLMGQDGCGAQTGQGSETCSETCSQKDMGGGSEFEGGKGCEDRVPSSSARPAGDCADENSAPEPDGEDEKGEKENDANPSDLDENKENVSATDNANRDMKLNAIGCETENCQSKNCDFPQKAGIFSSKTPQESLAQGAKYKALKPTNPKPFRLRTDERGILREANLERGKHQKETQVVGHRDKTQGRTKLVCVKHGRSDDAGTVFSTQRTKPLRNCKDKTAQRPLSKPEKPTTLQSSFKPQSNAIASGNTSTSPLGDKNETQAAMLRPKEAATCTRQAESSTITTTMSPHVRKANTIPKEPMFHKIHMPKSCTKRFEKAN